MYADEKIAKWLNKEGYHPRSDKHGKTLCDFFLDDLINECKFLRDLCEGGKVAFEKDHTIGAGTPLEWNIDLVLGPPAFGGQMQLMKTKIQRGEPEEIWLAYDSKSVMTEHGKARRNRQRDFNSFWQIVKSFYPKCVVGGAVLINMAKKFKSPLRDEITEHRNIRRLVRESIQIFKEIERCGPEGNDGIDALASIVVEHTNLSDAPTKLVQNPPAPQEGDIDHYKTTLETFCKALKERYSK